MNQGGPESGGDGPLLGDGLLSAAKAAAVLRDVYGVNVSDQSLLNWAKQGTLPEKCVGKAGGGVCRFDPAACAAWIKANKPAYGTHGGARSGAGRKPRAKPDPADILDREAEENRAAAERAQRERQANMLTDPSLLGEALAAMDAAEANRRFLIAKAGAAELEFRRLRGELIEAAAAAQSVRHVCTLLRSRLVGGAARWSRQIAHGLSLGEESQARVEGILREGVHEALQALSAMGVDGEAANNDENGAGGAGEAA